MSITLPEWAVGMTDGFRCNPDIDPWTGKPWTAGMDLRTVGDLTDKEFHNLNLTASAYGRQQFHFHNGKSLREANALARAEHNMPAGEPWTDANCASR